MCRLLLLEDDRGLIDGLKYSLEKNGFDLDVARTVQEARHALRGGHPYDLLLLDVTLPDGNGFMVCEEAHGPSDPYALESDTTGCRERPFQKAENICHGSGEKRTRSYTERRACNCVLRKVPLYNSDI